MAEGAHIDHGGHHNDIDYMLSELYAFDDMVKAVVNWAEQRDDTIVIVTADHETGGLTIINNNNRFDMAQNPYEYHFSTGGHSGGMVPIFAYGAGADAFSRVLENTDIPTIMKSLLTE